MSKRVRTTPMKRDRLTPLSHQIPVFLKGRPEVFKKPKEPRQTNNNLIKRQASCVNHFIVTNYDGRVARLNEFRWDHCTFY